MEAQIKVYEAKEQARKATVFNPGFMYWSGPYLLSSDWAAVLTGTVEEVEKYNPKSYLTLYKGKIKINDVLFSRSTKKAKFVKTDYLACDGGFKDLKAGDRVIVFLTEYEDGFAIADYSGTNCQLGIKVKTFNDSVVAAVKDRIKTGKISVLYQPIWQTMHPKAFNSYIKQLNYKQKSVENPKNIKKRKKTLKTLKFDAFFEKFFLKKSMMGVDYVSYFEFTDLIPPVSFMETRGCFSRMVAILFINYEA